MATIGTFTLTKDGFHGTIQTLALSAKLKLVPIIERSSETSPHYRLFVDAFECGAAWRRPSTSFGRGVLSLKIDDPTFSQPIKALLIQDEPDEPSYSLIWTRQS